MTTKQAKRINYPEGQWFAVPLTPDGFALGIIVRGSSKTKGGLGYFFGPKYFKLPTGEDTQNVGASDAVLITWFGDLGIVQGDWPLIESTRIFKREVWPVPKFARIDLVDNSRGWLVEYDQAGTGFTSPLRETPCPAHRLAGLPKDVLSGSGAVEKKLTYLLK
jgi:hypothetical protein